MCLNQCGVMSSQHLNDEEFVAAVRKESHRRFSRHSAIEPVAQWLLETLLHRDTTTTYSVGAIHLADVHLNSEASATMQEHRRPSELNQNIKMKRIAMCTLGETTTSPFVKQRKRGGSNTTTTSSSSSFGGGDDGLPLGVRSPRNRFWSTRTLMLNNENLDDNVIHERIIDILKPFQYQQSEQQLVYHFFNGFGRLTLRVAVVKHHEFTSPEMDKVGKSEQMWIHECLKHLECILYRTLYDEYQDQSRAILDLFGRIAEQLSKPLTNANSMLEMLNNDVSPTTTTTTSPASSGAPSVEERQEYIDMLEQATGDMASVVNDMWDILALQTNEVKLKEEPFSLRESILSTLEIVRCDAQEKGLKLINTMSRCLPERILGDATRIKQLIINLLSNAIKYTSSGSVTLNVYLESSALAESLIQNYCAQRREISTSPLSVPHTTPRPHPPLLSSPQQRHSRMLLQRSSQLIASIQKRRHRQMSGEFTLTPQRKLISSPTSSSSSRLKSGIHRRSSLVTVPAKQENYKVITLTVSDTGAGIDEKKLHNIFRAYASPRGLSGGIGLGLAICRLLVQLMGGRMWVKSKLGHGTTFGINMVVLPHRDMNEDKKKWAKALNDKTVLLVCPDERTRKIIYQTIMIYTRMRLIEYDNVNDALEYLENVDIASLDGAILDSDMLPSSNMDIICNILKHKSNVPFIGIYRTPTTTPASSNTLRPLRIRSAS